MRNKIIIGVVVLLLIVGVWYGMTRNEENNDVVIDTTTTEEPIQSLGPITIESDTTPEELAEQVDAVNTTGPSVVEQDSESELQVSLGKFASSFVERLGSYSSDANYSNLRELFPLMASDYRVAMKKVASGGEPENQNFSITTKALSAKPLEGNVYEVTTQKEKLDYDVPTTIYQKATVSLTQEGEDWLVSGVSWGEENVL